MNRAFPAQLRKAIEAANAYVKAGILFVPMPVADETEQRQRLAEADARLEEMAVAAEKGGAA
ncbi:DUF1382 family protein [Crenobacter cavernae]|uniref:DUF1382 family protein n=1 Tax=Crenobacter cavernae TaxID=2290923 RepID=A0ABY0FAQ5_9NEIS|nr:DUF1382 family protein [Crenobacter cavernae]RXZ42666.1 DUF1382 family protein [Crenobacter cavernae]